MTFEELDLENMTPEELFTAGKEILSGEINCEKKLEGALRCMAAAAQQDLPGAWYLCGLMAREGYEDSPGDELAAFSFFERGAEAGNYDSMAEVADLYAAQEQEEKALYWYEKAAESQIPEHRFKYAVRLLSHDPEQLGKFWQLIQGLEIEEEDY